MPRQFHPLYLKLQTTASVRFFCLNLQTTVFVFCITSLFELLSSTSGEQQKGEIKNNLDGLKTARRETLFYLLDCCVITVKFILSYNLLLT